MKSEDEILKMFDAYFENASIEEINKEVALINNLGFEGVTFEEYLSGLNNVTAYNLKETGICDDIAYADLFNHLINPIEMGNNKIVESIECIKVSIPNALFAYNVQYSLAA